MKRTIAVVTSSRADYSHLYWPLKDLEAHPGIELKLIVMAAHLSPQFGATVAEIERDGFAVAARVECLLSSDSDAGMAKTLGVAVLGLSDVLGAMRPDVLLLIADRYEMLAPACVALTLRIPIAHIEGGEVSEGAIDDAVRNALTKMAHVHFTSTEEARRRVIAMGEEAWRVHRAGAPSLDHLRRSRLLSRADTEEALGMQLAGETIVVAYHPVTLAKDGSLEAEALFAALEMVARREGAQIVFCYPNADAGSYAVMQQAREFCERHENARFFVNLPAVTYWSVLREAAAMIGNSSSGIMEAASFGLPVVDVGKRQLGRERGANVLSVVLDEGSNDPAPIVRQIETALSVAFRERLSGCENMYGDGRAAERIVRVLTEVPLEQLLHKRAQPVVFDDGGR